MKKSQNKSTKPVMKKIWLTYEQTSDGGAVCAGEDPNDKYACHDDTCINNEFKQLHLNQPKEFFCDSQEVTEEVYDTIEKLGHGYVVMVIYTSGDSFGSTSGNFTWVGLFDNQEDANSLEESIRDNSYKGYKPWEGYFESLDDVKNLILVCN